MTTNQKSGCLAALLGWLGLTPTAKPAEEEPSFPYHLRDDFLSPAEISFYHILRGIVGDRAIVCPKVSLGDLFYAATGDYGQNRSWMNRINQKHVDFLICDPDTVRPTIGVELDDGSHANRDRRERDAFVDEVFSAAGLPLARITAQADYNTGEVEAMLRRAMGDPPNGESEPAEAVVEAPREPQMEPGAQPHAESVATVRTSPPLCPKCGTTMVLREVKRPGPRQGQRFWGCPNFPKCHGTRDLEDTP